MSECVFEQFNECGLKQDSLIDVEMNFHDGKFVAHQDRETSGSVGPAIDAVRVTGKAHLSCYKEWYESVYKSPFTVTE